MRTKSFVVSGVVVLGLMIVVIWGARMGRAQEPQVVPPALAPAEQGGPELQDVQATALDAQWRERLGQDGQDNNRVQRRATDTSPWETLFALSKQGNLVLRGTRLFLGMTNPARLDRVAEDVLEVYVKNERMLRIEQDDTAPNWIGGHSSNSVDAAVYGATIGGGRDNMVTGGTYGTIAGGEQNTASNEATTVGGGVENTASGYVATVAGGSYNTASDHYTVVGGGTANSASADFATVGGGWVNTASGVAATVPGGEDNVAAGSHSFAAGWKAKANDDGTFVWSDASIVDLNSSAPNQFLVRASGGIWFGAYDGMGPMTPEIGEDAFIDTSTGGFLSKGGAWTDVSDRNGKANLTAVEGKDVLTRLAALPIYSWSYKAEDPAVRHMGPTAQDFYAAFGLGADEQHIAALDSSGVALAAIQALAEENATLRGEIQTLEARLAALEAAVAAGAQPARP